MHCNGFLFLVTLVVNSIISNSNITTFKSISFVFLIINDTPAKLSYSLQQQIKEYMHFSILIVVFQVEIDMYLY